MKVPNYLDIQVLKVFILLGIMVLNNSIIYGQDPMEDAKISLSFTDENDVKSITALATDKDGLPIEELDLYFYVVRTFSLLPIGDIFNTTDENGEVFVEFPNDLPGDSEGNVIIVVKIIESDIYNDSTLEITKNWGLPIILEDSKVEKRSLWAAAANAPISLIIIVSLTIISVWYIICYILFKLYKLSRVKPLVDD
jgi:hypothetical protein